MPRRNRCLLAGVAYHITQRGVDRRSTFASSADRLAYLALLRDNQAEAEVRLLAYCLMTNHVHLIAVPEREDSLAVLLRRVHGRYAQYFNIRHGRTGHLWQNRYFACVLQEDHVWTALAYVERNPVRAGMVERAADYPWSSAAAHVSGADASGLLDMSWWGQEGPSDWSQTIGGEDTEALADLRRCTYSGRPFGDQDFVAEMSRSFGRYWARGRPPKERPDAKMATRMSNQIPLF